MFFYLFKKPFINQIDYVKVENSRETYKYLDLRFDVWLLFRHKFVHLLPALGLWWWMSLSYRNN